MDSVLQELGQIAGLKAVKTKAKKSIAGFKLREGMEIGAMVTSRGNHMYDFFDKTEQESIKYIDKNNKCYLSCGHCAFSVEGRQNVFKCQIIIEANTVSNNKFRQEQSYILAKSREEQRVVAAKFLIRSEKVKLGDIKNI